MFDKVLVPVDGSDQSRRGAGWAAGLGKALGASLTFLTVVDPENLQLPESEARHEASRTRGGPREGSQDAPPLSMEEGSAAGRGYAGVVAAVPAAPGSDSPAAFGTQVVDSAVERARGYLRDTAREVGLDQDGVAIETAVGNPAEEIVSAAKRLGVDAIAMMSSRESTLARGILGSVTDRVLHTTDLPVAVIHPRTLGDARGAPIGEVIVPLDGSELSERAVPVARAVAESAGAGILFIRVVAPPFPSMPEGGPGYAPVECQSEELAYLEQFVAEAREAGLPARSFALKGRAAGTVNQIAEEIEGGLIVMTTHGRSGFRRFFFGSVADKIVRSAASPVLVLPSSGG